MGGGVVGLVVLVADAVSITVSISAGEVVAADLGRRNRLRVVVGLGRRKRLRVMVDLGRRNCLTTVAVGDLELVMGTVGGIVTEIAQIEITVGEDAIVIRTFDNKVEAENQRSEVLVAYISTVEMEVFQMEEVA